MDNLVDGDVIKFNGEVGDIITIQSGNANLYVEIMPYGFDLRMWKDGDDGNTPADEAILADHMRFGIDTQATT